MMRVKGEQKAGIKLNIQNTKIMVSSPITSWQIDGNKVETVTDFIYLFIYLFIYFWSPKSLWMVAEAMKLKDIYCLKGKL